MIINVNNSSCYVERLDRHQEVCVTTGDDSSNTWTCRSASAVGGWNGPVYPCLDNESASRNIKQWQCHSLSNVSNHDHCYSTSVI